jgi:hypothetical protein
MELKNNTKNIFKSSQINQQTNKQTSLKQNYKKLEL